MKTKLMTKKIKAMKSIITSLFVLILGISNSFSQYSISGKISDQQNQSLPFANIVLEEIGNKKKPTGTVSTDNGDYLLENVASGKYTIEISMLCLSEINHSTSALP